MPIESTPFCAKEIQRFLGVEQDGKWGDETETAARKILNFPKYDTGKPWGKKRLIIAVQQLIMKNAGIKVEVDGLLGPATLAAMEEWQRKGKELDMPKIQAGAGKELSWWEKVKQWWYSDTEPSPAEGPLKVQPSVTIAENPKINAPAIVKAKVKLQSNKWPEYKDLTDFFGARGSNQVRIQLPYTMTLDWDPKVQVNTIVCNKKVASSLQRIFEAVYQEYGDEEIKKLGLDKYGGCLNVRKVRGGNSWSIHSWGAAVDVNPERNQFRWTHKQARLAKPDAERFWEIVEAESWVSLGRQRDYDWMHFEATRPSWAK